LGDTRTAGMAYLETPWLPDDTEDTAIERIC
jgi:hypothetical protein